MRGVNVTVETVGRQRGQRFLPDRTAHDFQCHARNAARLDAPDRHDAKACNAIWRKGRYLSSQKLEKLGPVLRFILEDGDAHLGVICPDWDQPCRSGDEVVVSNAVLHHAEHHVV